MTQLIAMKIKLQHPLWKGALCGLTVAILFASPTIAQTPSQVVSELATASQTELTLPRDQWPAAGLKIEEVQRQPFSKTLHLTGKVSINQDRLAHIYSIVEGTVEDVKVRLGQSVRQDDLLAVIHSREIGAAKLLLYQARLQLELANARNDMQSRIVSNATDLLECLRSQMPIQEIEVRFRDRPLGDYRERALAAYAAFVKSEADVDRLEGVSSSGAVSGKSLLAATATRNADQATFQSRIEQISYELTTSTLLTSQAVKESEAKVLVAATSLQILGVDARDIEAINPAEQGETLSHYTIRAPFDGTVLSKDVVLREQVRPDVMLLSIADLSTVWVSADIYEEHLPLLDSLKHQTITIRNDALPDQTFTAKVFFTGEVMDELTRTISMLAIADNADRHLKPGMFVKLDLPIAQQQTPILIPSSAVQEHQSKKFVFVLQGTDQFLRRDVTLGLANDSQVVVKQGLREGESIVTAGGFILKSQMLAELMGEE